MQTSSLELTKAGLIAALTPKLQAFEVEIDGEVIGSVKPSVGAYEKQCGRYELTLGTRKSWHGSPEAALQAAQASWDGGWGEVYRWQQERAGEADSLVPALREPWRRVQRAKTSRAIALARVPARSDELARTDAELAAAETAFAAAERSMAEAA